jgi:hypothetical protein
MTPPVEGAVEELRASFPDAEVVVSGTGDGGVLVTIDPVFLGYIYDQDSTWVKFAISFQYPHADIYPLFVRPDLTRIDGRDHSPAIASGSFQGEPATQVSRRNNRLNPATDTAAIKVLKVVEWLRSQ